MSTWTAPHPPGPVCATVTVPGSKSQTNRALVLAALAAANGGVSTISGALRSRDTDLMIGALGALGLRVEGSAAELTISGTISPAADARIDCGLAGTVLRFVPPLAGLGVAAVTFDGDPSSPQVLQVTLSEADLEHVAQLLAGLLSRKLEANAPTSPSTEAATGRAVSSRKLDVAAAPAARE